jgi:hypothetical protein
VGSKVERDGEFYWNILYACMEISQWKPPAPLIYTDRKRKQRKDLNRYVSGK